MRKSLCTVGALTTFLLTSAMTSHTASAKTCQDLLGSNAYHCQIKVEPSSGIEPFGACFTFIAEAPGVQPNFVLHLVVDEFPGDLFALSCNCKAERAFKNPAFGKSREFLCASIHSEEFVNLAVEGEAGKDEISGQFVDESGLAYVYKCVLDPTCKGGR